MTLPEILILIFLAVLILLALLIMVRQASLKKSIRSDELKNEVLRMRGQLDAGTRSSAEFNASLRGEIRESLQDGMDSQSEQLRRISQDQSEQLRNSARDQTRTLLEMQERQNTSLRQINDQNAKFQEAVVRALTESMDKLQKANDERLNAMQGVVSEKLDTTLNERLDTNFSKVTEQLANLYRSLGELRDLSSGVTELNHTLSNVKTRGVWGEIQLQRILEDTMARSQYEVNVATKRGSDDRVEFAVKFPSAEAEGETVLLPIDAKFPTDLYNRIVEASQSEDREALAAAVSDLKKRIREEAQTISSKYLDPPRTTNYAFLYLPTEGLYSEVLRIDGLSEECQRKGVILTGPTTITAVLNSLQVGFRNIALSKKSVEVMKTLEAVKAQIGRMNDSVEKTQKKLNEAVSLTEDLHKRTWHISNRMKRIGEMDETEADRVLEIEDLRPAPESVPEIGDPRPAPDGE